MKKVLLKNFLLVFAAVGLLAGCATQAPDVTTYYDQVTGLRTDLMSDNELVGPGQPREIVWLNASRVFGSFKESEYYLEVSYMALPDVGYLEIPAGQTLTLVADGTSLVLNGTGSANMRKTYQQGNQEFVRETAIYPVTRVQLQRLASSRDIKVRIKGNNGLIERDFQEANHERLRRFVNAYAL